VSLHTESDKTLSQTFLETELSSPRLDM